MRKNILIFGLISGLIVSILMAASITLCYYNKDFTGNMVLGYTIMVLSFSLIFVGIKNYRDKYLDGVISYGKAFKIGILITLIASTFYVITWAIVYNLFLPDFMDILGEHSVNKEKANGASALKIKELTEQMAMYKELYKNPVYFVGLTYLEIFPIGLIVTLITSAFLMKKRKPVDTFS